MTKYKKILFATKNSGKLIEFKKAFTKLSCNFEVISFNDLTYDIPDCDETGSTFEENALLKVRNARAHLRNADRQLIVVADDSGMEIASLGGEPGVFTRRWNGQEMTDDEIINYCLNKLKGETNRAASYVSCFAISTSDGTEKIILDKSSGVILQKPRQSSKLTGLPFRSLFFVPDLNMMFHETRDLSESELEGYKIGHESALVSAVSYLSGREESPLSGASYISGRQTTALA